MQTRTIDRTDARPPPPVAPRQSSVRFARTLLGRALYFFIVGAALAGGAAWAASAPPPAVEAVTRTQVPGVVEFDVGSPGEVIVVYEGLSKATTHEIGLGATDASGAALPVVDDAPTPAAVGIHDGTPSPAYRLGTFEAVTAGRYRIHASRSIELSAHVRIEPSTDARLFARLARWIVVGLAALLAIVLCTAKASVRAPR